MMRVQAYTLGVKRNISSKNVLLNFQIKPNKFDSFTLGIKRKFAMLYKLNFLKVFIIFVSLLKVKSFRRPIGV